MELYAERGFEQTTVAEIAKRAGLTERTFFRHYADKREVLFGGSHVLEDLVVGTVRDAPEGTAPIDAVAAGLDAAATGIFSDLRDFARRRQAIITAHQDLRERELIKLASLSSALADTLRGRGVSEPAASLAAEAGTAVFKVAFERWVGDGETRDLAAVIRECQAELRSVAAGE